MDLASHVEIPKRALFKASEVCDLAKVQPYVLRSWEAEFPALGVAKAAGAPRTYRREDVEQVLRIKHLLLVEGLTLAGARKRLEEETAPVAASEPMIDELIGRNARERLTTVKRGLQSILDLLAGRRSEEFELSPPTALPARAQTASLDRGKLMRVKSAAGKNGSPAKNGSAARNGSRAARAPHARRRK
jgi:DNA-binding transcriptional MerR regulator